MAYCAVGKQSEMNGNIWPMALYCIGKQSGMNGYIGPVALYSRKAAWNGR